MMNMSSVLTQMGVLFITLAIGYLAHKCKLFSPTTDGLLTKVVMNIALPCTCLNSVLTGNVTISGREVVFFIAFSLLTIIVPIVLFYFLPNLMRAPLKDHGLYRFMILFGNCGFMGFPVIQSIFGASAIFYVALFLIPYNLLSYTLGIILVSGGAGNFTPKKLLNMPFIASMATVLVYISGVKAPAVIMSTISSLNALTTPLAMLVTGSTLAALPLKEIFSQWRVYPVTLVRLVACPLLTYFLLGMFVKDPTMLGILTVEAGMPVAVNATLFSLSYGGNELLASRGVFISTFLSVFTIPLMVLLLI